MGTSVLSTFLTRTLSQKTTSLIIARTPERAIRALEAEGFTNLQDPRDLERSGKRYIWVSMENAKEVYDLALQYGTGQITMFDEAHHAPLWINPAYPKSAIVLVIDREDLHDVEESGLPLRSVSGLTMQTA